MGSRGRLLFGEFELRLDGGELFRAGFPVKLQPQPTRVLELLARRSGEVVGREELRRHLWGEDTFVDFEHGLNFSIRQIRRALGDSADSPRFVETIPKYGYRFLPPVTLEAPVLEPAVPARPPRRWRAGAMLAALAAAALILGIGLHPVARQEGVPPPGLPREAWEAYLDGRYLTRPRASDEERAKGAVVLERAVLLAPRFAPAHAALAHARLRKEPAVAEAAARRAVALDPRQREAHVILAAVHFKYHYDFAEAEREVGLALRIDPRSPDAHRIRADLLGAMGRHEEAIAEAERALALDPENLGVEPDLDCFHRYLARQYDEAIRCSRRVLDRVPSPDNLMARVWIFNSAWLSGDPETALVEARVLAAAAPPEPLPPPRRFGTLDDFWRWQAERHAAFAERQPLPSGMRAVPLLALGEPDRALDLLEESAVRRDYWAFPFLAVDPRFDPLRGHPRFERLLERSGLGG